MRIITAIPAAVASSPDEERYLCGAVSEYLRARVDPADIVWRYAGVRPLLDDGASKAQEATRDYVLALEAPALLSVFGGKITTYRRLAEAAMAKLARLFPGMRGAWTAGVALPGGDFPWDGIEQVRGDLARRYPFLVRCEQCVAWFAPTARWRRTCWAMRAALPTWGAVSAPTSPSGRLTG